MKLLKSMSVDRHGKILVQDHESNEWREFDSMNDAIQFLGKCNDEGKCDETRLTKDIT